ncbi:MAG: sulfite exporter TauE/SafE family protein [Cyanobium sp.]
MVSLPGYGAIALAALAAGLVNALAGGGSLISFPTLTAVGLPAVVANVTNTLALSPGYLGATLAQRDQLRGQRQRILLLLPAAALGGLTGGLLLLASDEALFRRLVPWLILAGSLLLAAQEPLRAWLLRRKRPDGPGLPEAWSIVPVFLASIYGGYFGAGLSVILLAVLALTLEDNLTRLNGLKQAIALVVNLAASGLFLLAGPVQAPAAAVMAVGATIGGALGGTIAAKVDPAALRNLVVTIGVVVALILFAV